MRSILLFVSCLLAFISIVLSVLPFGLIALIPIVIGLTLSWVCYKKTLNDSKKLIFIQLIIVVFVFSSCLTFYNTLRPNTIAISNEASAKEEQNDLETLEELENIEIEN
ncbi:hypothetical protein N8768_03425 [Flavobacteriaceae bacterium]|jgi:type VI protein secretion system component VasK|nr:hypothetical protein [Flavobacteriaceae bacterium]